MGPRNPLYRLRAHVPSCLAGIQRGRPAMAMTTIATAAERSTAPPRAGVAADSVNRDGAARVAEEAPTRAILLPQRRDDEFDERSAEVHQLRRVFGGEPLDDAPKIGHMRAAVASRPPTGSAAAHSLTADGLKRSSRDRLDVGRLGRWSRFCRHFGRVAGAPGDDVAGAADYPRSVDIAPQPVSEAATWRPRPDRQAESARASRCGNEDRAAWPLHLPWPAGRQDADRE